MGVEIVRLVSCVPGDTQSTAAPSTRQGLGRAQRPARERLVPFRDVDDDVLHQPRRRQAAQGPEEASDAVVLEWRDGKGERDQGFSVCAVGESRVGAYRCWSPVFSLAFAMIAVASSTPIDGRLARSTAYFTHVTPVGRWKSSGNRGKSLSTT
jgi:hypothetical protein